MMTGKALGRASRCILGGGLRKLGSCRRDAMRRASGRADKPFNHYCEGYDRCDDLDNEGLLCVKGLGILFIKKQP